MGLSVPGEAGVDVEGLLKSRMGISLRVSLTEDLHGRVGVEELHGAQAGLFHGGFHRGTSRDRLHTREIQIFRKSIVAEVALERCRL